MEKSLNKVLLPVLATMFASPVFALDAKSVTDKLDGSSATLETVGVTLIGIFAAIWVVKRVIALIR